MIQRTRTAVASLLALLLCALLLSSQGCGAGKQAASENGKIFPYPYQIHDLPNGLRTVLVNSGYPNVVALYVVMQVGSRNEVEPGHTGFAHLFEHMMFRGTKKFPPEKWEQIMQAAGAETNAYTTDDRTVYHAVFSKEDLEKILELEADRFQNLSYSEEMFRTETRAVLGEYNKNFADPFQKLEEASRDTAFVTHPYKHTTMGYIQDVENMPGMYEYGLTFFHRYYRPEYAVLSVVGDIDFDSTEAMVEKYWGGWEKGDYSATIPSEPPQNAPKEVTVDFHAPTLPIVEVAFQAPAYSDEQVDSAALDVISFYAFGDSSELYKQLVINEQKVDLLSPAYYDHVDPYPFAVIARVKNAADVDYVQQRILDTFEKLKTDPIPAKELGDVKSHLRYQFALSMDSTSAIADTLAHYLGLARTPETINKRYALYRAVTPEDIQTVAQKYFNEKERTIAHLAYAPGGAEKGEGE